MKTRPLESGDAPPRLNLVGAGSVGCTLFRLFAASNKFAVQDIYGRDETRVAQAVSFIGGGEARTSLSAMRPADVWFMTVPDRMIMPVAREIASEALSSPAIAVHCSGFLPASELSPLSRLGWGVASAHPVMTFADKEAAVDGFPGTFCGMEGDRCAVDRVAAILAAIGAKPFAIKPGSKTLYHAAAVLSNNLAVVLQAVAREAWAEAGVPDEISPMLNAALLSSTVKNVTTMGPAAALSGPASRGDWSVVEQQAQALDQWHPDAGRAYRSLSVMAGRLKQTGSTLQSEGYDPTRRVSAEPT
ncbi:DUF2520 domain-containing protein [Mesorhizobium sp. CAU 1741]|uniref:Rossmann-like and DUF2520 domain-containing protein n=1 Tax=Mesorhizobium sp. CAU 1741 TaxID=3140366 RepID=UPI00325B47C5